MKCLRLNVTNEDILAAQKAKQFDSSRDIGAEPIAKAFRRQFCMCVRTSPLGGRFLVEGNDTTELAPNPSVGKYLQDYWADKEIGPRTFRIKISKLGTLYRSDHRVELSECFQPLGDSWSQQ